MPFNRTIFNGNGRNVTISLNFLISLAAVIVLGVVGWSVLKVTELPTTFAEQRYVDKHITEVSARIDREKTNINQRVDREVAILSKDIVDMTTILNDKICTTNSELKEIKTKVEQQTNIVSNKLDAIHKDIKKKRTE